MSETPTQRRFEDLLPRVRRPARLIGGETGSSSGFTEDPHELRVVLAFPDTYEIGISNQAVQILYGLACRTDGVAVERTYLPWVDVTGEMRKEQIPLLTLETWSPVGSADVVGFTLQHESSYTNLLEMLDLAGLPIRSGERTRDHPLIVVGGPACANFLPLSPFIDAAVVGDGEEVFGEILDIMKESKREGADRARTKSQLSEVEGVFVPGLSASVTRRCVPRLCDAPYPASCLVPVTEGVHDRAWVEVMRGCTRGCRFCQAGMWYRPVRERPMDQVLAMTGAQLRATGYQEVALASLSTTDYSALGPLLTEVAEAHPEVKVSLPSLRVDSAAVKLAGLASPTGASLTLAPEAGSQRMRDVINKNVTEADILAATEEAMRAGKTTLKLYFMIGLPWEEDEDASAIADLCLKIRDIAQGIMGSRASRLKLNVSVNNFIPKPFTPLQWAGMATRQTLRRRQGLIRERLRKRGVRVSFSRIETSYLEAALARGEEQMADVIESAWERGARLDSWTEQFVDEAWNDAFESAGLSAEALATATIDLDSVLSWDVVKGVVDKDFLREEWHKAIRRETTPDCRWDECAGCGVCEGSLGNDIADAYQQEHAARTRLDATAAPCGEGARPQERWRYVATFSVTGKGRFLGHLDRAEIFRRAVRRAGGRLALSAGMRPKALLSLALPLAVGAEGRRELAEFELVAPADEGFAARLDQSLPAHMRLTDLRSREGGRRSLAAQVVAASYEVVVRVVGADGDIVPTLEDAIRRLSESESLMFEEIRGGAKRQVDIREYVDSIEWTGDVPDNLTLSFKARVSPQGTVRAAWVVQALAELAGLNLEVRRVTRTRVHLTGDGE